MSNKIYTLEIEDDDGNVLKRYHFSHWEERWIFKLMKGYR